MNIDTCRMKKVAGEEAVREGAPGSFCIVEVTEDDTTFKRLWAKLPHGEVGGFALEPAPAQIPGVWAWNGSETKPTLNRQIRLLGRWVGQIKAGRMVSAPEQQQDAIDMTPRPLPKPQPITAAVSNAIRQKRIG